MSNIGVFQRIFCIAVALLLISVPFSASAVASPVVDAARAGSGQNDDDPIKILRNTHTETIVQAGNHIYTTKSNNEHTFATTDDLNLITGQITQMSEIHVTRQNLDAGSHTEVIYNTETYSGGQLINTRTYSVDPLEPGALLTLRKPHQSDEPLPGMVGKSVYSYYGMTFAKSNDPQEIYYPHPDYATHHISPNNLYDRVAGNGMTDIRVKDVAFDALLLLPAVVAGDLLAAALIAAGITAPLGILVALCTSALESIAVVGVSTVTDESGGVWILSDDLFRPGNSPPLYYLRIGGRTIYNNGGIFTDP